ncbi:MAG: glycosyltransferase family 2 protein [Patescibacteria group bacterium]|nr:glycosyltransferase family 2 protein [Patescibacteria group bacterium]
MKLSVIIPVYNEIGTLEKILKKVKDVKVPKEIILVDDGSTDGSREFLEELKRKDTALKVIFQKENQGKGAALRVGFKKVSGDYVIVQDADLEYDPRDYLKLLKELKGSKTVIYGSRFMGSYKDMTSLHFFGNRILTVLTNLLFGVALTDMETCYKLIPVELIKKIEIKSNRFNFEPEITAKILKNGYKIKEVPISYAGRTASEGKKITWRDGFSALATLIKFRFLS